MSTPKPESSGPPLRALAMVLIALAILFAGLGFASLGGSDSEETATTATTTAAVTTTAAARTTTAAAGATSASTTSTTSGASSTSKSADAASVPVRVLNNSNVTGLASQTATKLMSSGWTVSETGNYSDGTISETTVYYGTSAAEKEAATEIAAQLGVSAQPRFPGIANSSAGVIVIVTSAQ
ncbi:MULTISPECIES: LytR C-terminal domain-containing protein [unclassified Rhodococcus (in: high G+C Gram-positive bacteria)]|uniref:LytR C-terminal domain-containing protein n=1 Tax=unclassified Rhodococcus (in: high G+C Gram-positive bacteria) TaxID=192944 RepID=UPI00163B2196|nr:MULTISPECIES: LytR C-terminal domain-containing protein [unclassified Rhodococcus (in: high G+C Gram-positive bacteria)]MBC2639568.1 LytR C-terminal domain-containing protein [Rhodococcus sp. 3A]MBC2895687.1 LytR C-terminal domain-containing protein [Rhodococcus sp. 4CII]